MIPRPALSVIGVLLFAAIVFALPAGRIPIWEPNDARYGLLAQDILTHGRWLTPELRGEPYLNKPLLYVWSVALASLPVGRVSELTAALPSLVSSLVGVAGVMAIGSLLWGGRAGILAGLILATTPMYVTRATRALPDVMMTAFLIWALYFALRAHRRDGTLASLLGLYGCIGGAMLSKGPAGLAALPAALLAALLTGGRAGLGRLRLGLGLTILGVLAIPWILPYLVEARRTFVTDVIVTHYGGWYLQKHGVAYRLAHLPAVLLNFLPWSVYLAGAVAWWRRGGPDDGRQWIAWWTATLWLLAGLSGMYRPRYFLPVYPGLALLTAEFLDRASARNGRRELRLASIAFGLVAIAAAALLLSPPALDGEDSVYLPTAGWERALIGLLLLIGAAAAALAAHRDAFTRAGVTVALVLGMILVVEGAMVPARRAHRDDVRALAEVAAAHAGPQGTVIAHPGLTLQYDFYLRRRVIEIAPTDAMARVLSAPSPDAVITTRKRWAALAASAAPSWRVLAARTVGHHEMVVLGSASP